jgi:hypothetical protein
LPVDTHIAPPAETPKIIESEDRAHGNSPEFRAGSPRQTNHGLNTRHSEAASPSDRQIIAHFTRPEPTKPAERN